MRIDGCQRMAIDTDVVIVGAGCLPGPMGSSIEFFGEPMKPWLTQMPVARKMDTPMSISGCSLFDGVTFDPFSFQEEGLTYAEVDVGRREVS